MTFTQRTDWKDLPDTSTPVDAADLLRWEQGIADANSAASSAYTTATNAASTANSAVTTASSARDTANSALSTANSALTAAQGAATGVTDAGVANQVNNGSQTQAALRAAFGAVVPLSRYAKADGTDQTTQIQAAIQAIYDAGGGTLLVDGHFRADGQLSVPFDSNTAAASMNASKAIRITGLDVGRNYYTDPATVATFGHSLLDLRYSGAGARLVALGSGVLELDHFTITDLAHASTTPFVMVTLAQPRFHDLLISGSPNQWQATCDQDAIVLGGTDTTQVGGVLTSAFAGYGGYIRNVSFSRIDRAVYARNFVNGIPITQCWIDRSCGSARTGTAAAPFIIDAGGLAPAHESYCNLIRENCIEVEGGYAYGIVLGQGTRYTVVEHNSFFDSGPNYLDDVYCDPDAQENSIDFRLGYGSHHVTQTGANKQLILRQTSIYGPSGWEMFINGSQDGSQGMTYEPSIDGPVIKGYGGIGFRTQGNTGPMGVLIAGHGSPEGVVTAGPGAIYSNVDGGTGTTLYVKETGTGNTGWIAK